MNLRVLTVTMSAMVSSFVRVERGVAVGVGVGRRTCKFGWVSTGPVAGTAKPCTVRVGCIGFVCDWCARLVCESMTKLYLIWG